MANRDFLSAEFERLQHERTTSNLKVAIARAGLEVIAGSGHTVPAQIAKTTLDEMEKQK